MTTKHLLTALLCWLAIGPAAAIAHADNYVIIDSKPVYRGPQTSNRPIATNGLRLLRVVRRHGSWMEVELVTGWPRHCDIGTNAKFAVHLYVRANDVVQVSRRSLTKQLGGGAAVRVARGTPIRGSLLTKLVAARDRTRQFSGRRPPFWPSGHMRFRVRTTSQLVLGRTLRVGVNKGTQVAIIRRSAAKLLVEVTRSCVQITGWLPRSAVDLTKPTPTPEQIPEGDPIGEVTQRVSGSVTGTMYGGILSRRRPKSRYASSGATIYWPDGSHAGTVGGMTKVKGIWGKHNQLACANTELAAGMPLVTLCFRPTDLFH